MTARSPVSYAAAAAVITLVLAACAASSPEKPGANSDTCAGHVDGARNELTTIIDANSECKVDADCTHVGFGAACFDSCSRPMAASGKAAFDAAVEAVNTGDCRAYKDDGCPAHISPPCAPPAAPACREGKCI